MWVSPQPILESPRFAYDTHPQILSVFSQLKDFKKPSSKTGAPIFCQGRGGVVCSGVQKQRGIWESELKKKYILSFNTLLLALLFHAHFQRYVIVPISEHFGDAWHELGQLSAFPMLGSDSFPVSAIFPSASQL